MHDFKPGDIVRIKQVSLKEAKKLCPTFPFCLEKGPSKILKYWGGKIGTGAPRRRDPNARVRADVPCRFRRPC